MRTTKSDFNCNEISSIPNCFLIFHICTIIRIQQVLNLHQYIINSKLFVLWIYWVFNCCCCCIPVYVFFMFIFFWFAMMIFFIYVRLRIIHFTLNQHNSLHFGLINFIYLYRFCCICFQCVCNYVFIQCTYNFFQLKIASKMQFFMIASLERYLIRDRFVLTFYVN